jgi:hypothetical protein
MTSGRPFALADAAPIVTPNSAAHTATVARAFERMRPASFRKERRPGPSLERDSFESLNQLG